MQITSRIINNNYLVEEDWILLAADAVDLVDSIRIGDSVVGAGSRDYNPVGYNNCSWFKRTKKEID